MIEGTTLLGFIAVALVLLLVPGPGVMYVIARGAMQGYKAGFVSAAGLSAGAFVHIIAATVGLSAILMASATAFTVVKLIGAGYLIYLGLQTIFSRRPVMSADGATVHSLRRLFIDGIVISVFNPKLALFFLAFLPQFVDPTLGSVPGQIVIFGLVYVALALITDGGYALLAGSFRRWIGGRFMQGPVPRYVSGSIYLGLGVGAALTGRRD